MFSSGMKESPHTSKKEKFDHTAQVVFTCMMVSIVGIIILSVGARILVEHFQEKDSKGATSANAVLQRSNSNTNFILEKEQVHTTLLPLTSIDA